MPKRISTQYPGVKYRMARRTGTTGTEKVYYIVYKKKGRLYEETAGREHSDSMTPAKAANIRLQKIEGALQPKSDTMRHKGAAKLQLDHLTRTFQETGDPIAALRAFCHAHDKGLQIPHLITAYMADHIDLYIHGKAQSLDHALGLRGQPITAKKNYENIKADLFKQTIQNIFDYLYLDQSTGAKRPHPSETTTQEEKKGEGPKSMKGNETLQPLLTETEVAEQLHLAVQTLRNWRYARRGPKWLALGRSVRYSPGDIDAFVRQGRRNHKDNN